MPSSTSAAAATQKNPADNRSDESAGRPSSDNFTPAFSTPRRLPSSERNRVAAAYSLISIASSIRSAAVAEEQSVHRILGLFRVLVAQRVERGAALGALLLRHLQSAEHTAESRAVIAIVEQRNVPAHADRVQ